MSGPDQSALFPGAGSSKRRGRPPGSKNRKSAATGQAGRIERALNGDLAGESTIPAGGRAHLRAAARALDVAEALADLDATAKLVRAYLEVRQAYGLAGNVREPLDPFAAFVAGMSAPSMGDTEKP